MNRTDNLRNSINEKLLSISNKDYLEALYQIVDKTAAESDILTLNEDQKKLLKMSDLDIKDGRLITQEQLDKDDLQWLICAR